MWEPFLKRQPSHILISPEWSHPIILLKCLDVEVGKRGERERGAMGKIRRSEAQLGGCAGGTVGWCIRLLRDEPRSPTGVKRLIGWQRKKQRLI